MKKILITCFAILTCGFTSSGQGVYELYTTNKFYEENTFLTREPNFDIPPSFDSVRSKLPIPYWFKKQDVVDCYWKAWEIAFSNLKKVTPQNGFVSPYIDAAFNGNIFMWDACFMTMFGRYGSRAFNFQGTLDNFYVKQKPDGFICREIFGSNGKDCFERFDPSSTGPNIMPWAEWEYYLNFNDKQRLSDVFPVLLAYYQWFNINRTWKDGSYYLSGWGCGMDNQPRVQEGYDVQWGNGHMSWIDAILQQVFSGKILIQMAEVLNRPADVENVRNEVDYLTRFVNDKMWNDKLKFYTDLFRDNSLSTTQTIGSYWSLLADVVPSDRMDVYIGHLSDTAKFNRPHRVPSLSADDPYYDKNGGYWRGSVWVPTAYMVLRGLTKIKQDSLAHEIGLNHYQNVLGVYNDTRTFFENYAPEKVQGNNAKNFVGWTGLTPIAVLFEYVFGIRADIPTNTIVWDVRLLDEFGVKQYPFGVDGLVDLECKARKKKTSKPEIRVKSNFDFTLKLICEGGSTDINIKEHLK